MTDTAPTRKIQGHCALCIARCGSIAEVSGDRLIALHPDPSHPTGQALCAKGRAAPELVHHPDRLLYPLKRTRPKHDPDPGWQRISWDEALETTAAALKRIAARDGPRAVVFTRASGSCTALNDAGGWIARLMRAFGACNHMNNLDICGWGRAYATRFVFGVGSVGTGGGGGAMPDIERAGCLILWGYNPSMSRLTHATATLSALKRGMKLIVIDPRQVGLANKADLWLRVRPGTDGALALGIAHVMIARGWFDRAFMRDWSNGPLLVRDDSGRFLRMQELDAATDPALLVGWNEANAAPVPFDPATGTWADGTRPALEGAITLRGADGSTIACRTAFTRYAALCAEYPPSRVAKLCWLAAEQVEAAARIIWQARPVAYYAWSGHEQHTNTTATARAIAQLYALTGCFDAPGGNVLMPGVAAGAAADTTGPARGASLGLVERPLGLGLHGMVSSEEIFRAVLEGEPYPVRGMVSFGGNLLLSHADPLRGRQALSALEFTVHLDMFMNPSAALADIVLPAASPFEAEALKLGFDVSPAAQARVQLRQAVLPPVGQARSDTRIIFDLACRMGLGNQFWNGDVEAGLRHQLAPTGIALEALREAPGGIDVELIPRFRKFEKAGFATPSRKVEVYSEALLTIGQDPLPGFIEPAAGPHSRPKLLEKFPLVLTSAKNTLFCESQHRNLPSLRRHAPNPELELHPDAAAARGLAEGDWVRIETPRGSVRARARLNASLDPRVVCGQHGWWQACEGANAPGYDPFSADGANLNLLLDGGTVDPVSGTQSLKSNLCEVHRAP